MHLHLCLWFNQEHVLSIELGKKIKTVVYICFASKEFGKALLLQFLFLFQNLITVMPLEMGDQSLVARPYILTDVGLVPRPKILYDNNNKRVRQSKSFISSFILFPSPGSCQVPAV